MIPFIQFITTVVTCFLSLLAVSWAGQSDIIHGIETERDPTVTSNNLSPSVVSNEYEMTFVYVSPGEFSMGSPLDEAGRKSSERRHKVILSQGFYIMTTEVTQKQWVAVMDSNPSAFDGCGPECPVENVSWTIANRFVKKLNQQAKLKGGISTENLEASGDQNQPGKNGIKPSVRLRYALPTEAQWEYACRAGSQGWFYFGGDTWRLSDYAWYKNNAGGQPHAVAQKKANAFGLYDMHGNVWEWCRDYAGPYSPKISNDPTGSAKGTLRIVRGGSWYYPALEARCANRLSLPPDMGNYNVGLRLVLIIEG